MKPVLESRDQQNNKTAQKYQKKDNPSPIVNIIAID
jgi:hypothetical protein